MSAGSRYRGRTLLTSLATAAAAVALAAGCGIPTDETAEVISDAPPELFEELPVSTPTATSPSDADINLRLYWHTETGVLVEVLRPLAEQPKTNQALEALAQGPTEAENAQDPSTLILRNFGVDTVPTFVSLDGNGTATIRVGPSFRGAADRRLGSAEIVCTMLQFRLIDSVIIIDDEGPITLTDNEATPIDGPAMAIHYADCKSPASSATTPREPATTVPDG